jgi:hypothetical protein
MIEYDKSKYSNPFDPITQLKDYRDFKNMVDTAYHDGCVKGYQIEVRLLLKQLKYKGADFESIQEVLKFSKNDFENL